MQIDGTRSFQGVARCTASYVGSRSHTSSQPPSAGLCVIPTNKDDTGDGVPTRAGRTTTATVLTTTATATLSLRVCASRPGHYHKTTTAGTFHNVYTVDGIKGDAEREVPEPRGGQALSHLVKTRSGQDTICQDTFHDACFCLTLHHKTSRQPPTRVPSTLSLTQRLLLPLPMQRSLQRSNTWLQHLPLPTYDEPATVIEYVAPAPVVLHAAPAPVIQCSALYKIGQEQKHSCIRKRRKKKRSDEYDVMGTFFSCLTFPVFFFKITRHPNNFEFSKLPITNLENFFRQYFKAKRC